jgi:hypothetical protein
MIVVADSIFDGVLLDVEQAFADLRSATDACRLRDDEVARANLRQCRARLDALLDMWNDAELTAGRR